MGLVNQEGRRDTLLTGTRITDTLLTPRLAPAALSLLELCKNWWNYAKSLEIMTFQIIWSFFLFLDTFRIKSV